MFALRHSVVVLMPNLLFEGTVCEIWFLWQKQDLTGIQSFIKFHTPCNSNKRKIAKIFKEKEIEEILNGVPLKCETKRSLPKRNETYRDRYSYFIRQALSNKYSTHFRVFRQKCFLHLNSEFLIFMNVHYTRTKIYFRIFK